MAEPELIGFEYVGSSGQIPTPDTKNLVRDWGNAVLRYMKVECPINKNPNAPSRGALRDSLGLEITGSDGDYSVSFTALDYIMPVLTGSRAHHIAPREKRALSFVWNVAAGRSGPISQATFGFKMNREGLPSIASMRRNAGFRIQPVMHFRMPTYPGEMTRRHAARYFPDQRYGGQRPNIHKRYVTPTNVFNNKFKKVGDQMNQYYGRIVLRGVNHPGHRGNDFVTRALNSAEEQAGKMEDAFGEDFANQIVAGLRI